MVGHQAVVVETERAASLIAVEKAEEVLDVGRIGKEGFSVMSARHDVVGGVFGQEVTAWLAGQTSCGGEG